MMCVLGRVAIFSVITVVSFAFMSVVKVSLGPRSARFWHLLQTYSPFFGNINEPHEQNKFSASKTPIG